MATIAIEMPATSASPEQAGALLRACNIAAAPDRCETADATSETPTSFAVVTWQGDLAVHVEVGQPGTQDWLERSISFVPEDPVLERWQAVGFAIGTLFGGTEAESRESSSREAPPAPAEARKEESPEAKPQSRERRQHGHSIQLALLGRLGTGTESSARFGGGVGLTARHASGPFLSADANLDLASLGVGSPPSSMSARFVIAGLSIGTALPLAPKLRLDLSAGPIIEYQWLWSDQSMTAQSRLVGGARGSVALAGRLGSRVWLGIGAQMGSRFGDTTVSVDGERADSVPLVFASAALSLSFDLWQSRTGPTR